MPTPSNVQPTDSHFVRITDSTKNMIFLTDQFGEPNEHQPAVEQRNALSMTSEDVEALVKAHSKCFSHEEAFLTYDKKTKALRIMVEFEIAIDCLPGAHPKNMKVGDLHVWRKALASYAPVLHYIEANLNRIDEETTGIETIFDFGGYNYGSICVMLPLERAERYTDAYLLLFENKVPFPPSNHAQLAALGALKWSVDAGIGIPAEILPAH
jgi:hypothetical protein